MATKQIYVKEEDLPLFDQAKEISGGESFSQIIADALKLYIRDRSRGIENLTVTIDGQKIMFKGKQQGDVFEVE